MGNEKNFRERKNPPPGAGPAGEKETGEDTPLLSVEDAEGDIFFLAEALGFRAFGSPDDG